ncbi:MAG TPA: cupin domain-containing protein [Acidobacteriaceae bacterium]|jgi:quercetin dioxygenase-like cupin family protein
MRTTIASMKRILVLALFVASTLTFTKTLTAQETITPIMSHTLAEASSSEVLMYTVDFPPGFASPIHRHDAQVSVYVLEGTVVMQVKGGKELTLGPGQSFYENPDDIHVVSRNASNSKPAKFLVFLIHKKDAPLVIPVP